MFGVEGDRRILTGVVVGVPRHGVGIGAHDDFTAVLGM